MSTGTTTVVDYYSSHGRSFMDCLASQGVSGIARYLTNSPTDPRQVTDSEITDAHAAGLSVLFFYEMNPTFAAYFTYAQGAEDCRQAVYRLRELGAPQGTVVYFAVDTNIDPQIVDEYFNGVESMATPEITPGVYGYQRMVEHARRNYPHVGKHLAQTYGRPQDALDLWQHEQVAMCGVAVDLNECSVAGWRPQEETMAEAPTFESQEETEQRIRVGEVRLLQSVFRYADGRVRTIQRKVWANKRGRFVVTVYPPVDPDADLTENIDSEPAVFVVTVFDPNQ